MPEPVLLSAEGEVVRITVAPDHPGPYSTLVSFLRQHLPGVWIDWVAVREAYRFGRGRPFPVGRRRAEAAFDERAKIRFSEDGLAAFLLLYPPRPRGSRLTEADLARLVRAYGVPPELVDAHALRMAFLRHSYQESELIARGRPPLDGAPARVDWVRGLPTDPEGFLAALESLGDLYPTEILAEVAEHGKAGTLHPPESGTPGLAASGAPIPARAGEDTIRLGPGLRLDPAEGTIVATATGHLRLSGRGATTARVLPLLRVREAQDLEPWRGAVFPGSIVVEGDLEVRFPLKVLGDVEVRGGLVRSSLEVMGSLFVRDGVIHRGHEPVRVGGILSAAFMDRAWVAAHTVHVRRYSLQSRLLGFDAVLAPSKGANLCGGQIACRKRVVADVLGSPNSMDTEVAVGAPGFNATFHAMFQSWADALRSLPTEEGPEETIREEAARWEKATLALTVPHLPHALIATQRVHAGVTIRIASALREIGNAVGPVSFTYEKIGDRDRVAMTRG
ncbi:MAG: DUF342 domain-containing protein [Deltaproteobacteria bacterium]|nr:DUF342 domain-containing protein [Deltaproteobacteria bacterium]